METGSVSLVFLCTSFPLLPTSLCRRPRRVGRIRNTSASRSSSVALRCCAARGQHDRIIRLPGRRRAILSSSFDRQRAFLEEFLHQRVVASRPSPQRLVRHLGRSKVGGNLFDFGLRPSGVHVRLHRDQVTTRENFSPADRNCNGTRSAKTRVIDSSRARKSPARGPSS